MDFIVSILSFILALGILVTVHEFGHFWVARKCGVKVLRFSVGFGKPLFTFYRKNDPTEYVVAGIPLGGYVKMLDESESQVEDSEKHLAFNNKPLFSKVLIVLAGPAFNLMFAFVIFWLVLIIGEVGLRPVIGELSKTGIAIESGLEIGDKITAVNNHPATIWRIASGHIMSGLLDEGKVGVTVIKPDGRVNNVQLQLVGDVMPEPSLLAQKVGIVPVLPFVKPMLDEVIKGEAAETAGLRAGDLIISANQKKISTWGEWVKLTRASPGKLLILEIERAGSINIIRLTPKAIIEGAETIGRIGATVFIDESIREQFNTDYSLDPISAISESARLTVHYSWLTLKMIGRMLVGSASVDNLSGPISLAQYAGKTASIGLVSFLKFLAFVSISLGVLNLLPIPMLDGGHLFFYAIEAIRGKAVSDRVMQLSMRLGMMILMSVMLLALFVDLNRVFV
ncbi:MAG: RIP metalloprotease RseP [Piscirickettsiaceae bacterium]|nr:MAG: RIP metalloprotease RseP [Piscirickettsiaceae bacterium]